MFVNDLLADSETKPGAAHQTRCRGIALPEGIKQLREVLSGDSFSPVNDREHKVLLAVDLGSQSHRRTGFGYRYRATSRDLAEVSVAN